MQDADRGALRRCVVQRRCDAQSLLSSRSLSTRETLPTPFCHVHSRAQLLACGSLRRSRALRDDFCE